MTVVEDRLAWIRHQLEVMADTRLTAAFTIAEAFYYNRLAGEEARLLHRLAAVNHTA